MDGKGNEKPDISQNLFQKPAPGQLGVTIPAPVTLPLQISLNN